MRKLIVAGVLLLVGCGPAVEQPQVTLLPTDVPAQLSTPGTGPAATATPVLEQPAATATPVAEQPATTVTPAAGQTYSFEQIQLTSPAELATTFSGKTVPAATYTPNDPPWVILPAYTELSLSGYPSQGLMEPRIQVYPVAEFAQINSTAAEQIELLTGLLADRPQATEDPLPQLPPVGAAQQFQARLTYIDFQNGTGIRYLTQLAQDVGPITNDRLLYVYQGITTDRKYYVSAILPVSAPFLASDFSAAVPQDGLPFPDYTASDFQRQYETYRQAVIARLDGAPAQELTPALDLLDALVQSISIEEGRVGAING